MKPSMSWRLSLVRNGKISFFVILRFHVRISSVFGQSHHWLYLVGHRNTHFFHVHNRYYAFAEQPCILDKGQKTFVIVIQTVAWQSEESGCHLLWDELRRVSHSLTNCCGTLMEYSWRKQVQSVHLCSWLAPQAKRAVESESNYSSVVPYGVYISAVCCTVPPIIQTCVQLGCATCYVMLNGL